MATPPVITSFSVTPTDPVTASTLAATVAYTSGTADSSDTWAGTETDQMGATRGVSETDTIQVPDPATVAVTDSAGGSWAKSSDDGGTAVFAATAPAQAGTLTVTAMATGPGSGLSATAQQDVTVLAPGVASHGAALGSLSFAALAPAASAWAQATGRPLLMRHHFLQSSIPASYAKSPFDGEAGVRGVLVDAEPAHDGSQVQALDTFLGSCVQAGLDIKMTLYHAAPSKFTTPSAFFTALARYAPVLAKHGVPYVFDLTAWQVDKQGALAGDLWSPLHVAQPAAFGVEFYADGFIHAGITLNRSAAWADAKGLPFCACEYGADFAMAGDKMGQVTEAQGLTFLAYFRDFLAARISAAKPLYDCLTWNDTAGGGYDPGFVISSQPASWQALYGQIHDLLTLSVPGRPYLPAAA